MFAPLTTVINTFGGQWYDMDWQAQVNSPAYKDAVKFYIDTLAASGEGDPVSFGFTECLNLFSQERAAMWYDATSAAGSVEDPSNSKVAGKVGYVRAPVQADRELGLVVVVEPRHQRRVPAQGPGLGVREVGDLEGVREPGRLPARLVEDPAGHPQVDVPQSRSTSRPAATSRR